MKASSQVGSEAWVYNLIPGAIDSGHARRPLLGSIHRLNLAGPSGYAEVKHTPRQANLFTVIYDYGLLTGPKRRCVSTSFPWHRHVKNKRWPLALCNVHAYGSSSYKRCLSVAFVSNLISLLHSNNRAVVFRHYKILNVPEILPLTLPIMVDPIILPVCATLSTPILHSAVKAALKLYHPKPLGQILREAQDNLTAVLDIIESLPETGAKAEAEELFVRYKG
jgi:hypothetical protein